MVDNVQDDLDIDVENGGEAAEMSMGDFQGSNFLKNPAVGDTIVFTVEKVVKNPKISGENRETGVKFDIGLKQKDGKINRYDIHTEQGIYTVNSWELFFKLFGSKADNEGILITYAKTHNKSFVGANVSVKRLHDGSHARMSTKDLAKIRGCSDKEADAYKKTVETALKEKKLYEVKLV